MALNPSPVTIANIFNKKYEVDFYQREYKWNDQQQTYKPINLLNHCWTIFFTVLICVIAPIWMRRKKLFLSTIGII
ncbi:hypothetical protein [Neobacillus jeddahensis]|uniref:hypothetical protein n=1 Tax=Neobacillus jeddahensis TaxID=1461580 RepID=UPI000B01E1F0|nr:hypothetical protein [Neobacillus jeddahensis]